jgi:hypothetical protein
MKIRTIGAGAAVALAALGGATAAEAGPPGKWTQVTGVGAPDLNIMQVGLARTGDGVLHVSWTRQGAGNAGSLLHSAVSANAKSVSGPNSIYEGPDGVNESSALVAVPGGGLRAFFAATNRFTDAMGSATSADGITWSPAAVVSRGGNASKPVYAAQGISAAVRGGAFYSAWGSSAPGTAGFHVGLDPNAPDGELPSSATDPGVGVDSQTGAAYVATVVLDEDAIAVQPIAPGGPRATIPNSGAAQLLHRVGVTGRIGKPGVYVAYTQGDNQFTGRPAVYRVGDGDTLRVGPKGGEDVSIAAAPSGRLWVFWKDGSTVLARRSNKAATRFGAVRALRAPKGSGSISDLAGEGSRGPLDLLALVDPSASGMANWHQRILPGLTLTAKVKKNGKVTFKVTDAGDAVKGATVKAGGEKGKTGKKGTVTLKLDDGRHKGKATKKGYAKATKRLRVK